MNNLELKVIFQAVDKFVRPVKQITGAASEAAKALRDNNARMKELNRTVEQIDAFKKVEKDAAITANTFAKVRRQTDELKAAIDKTGVPTKKQAAELAALTRRSEELRQKHQSLTTTEQKLFEKLKQSGLDTRKLAEERRRLASASAEATNASRRLQANLEAENQKMRKLRAAQADLSKAKEKAGKLAMAGAGIAAGGAAVGLPAATATNDFRDFEWAMLGVAKQMEGARDASGKLTAEYWQMAASIKALSEVLPGTANDIAAIVEGGARMGIQGRENLLIYAEATAIMANAFELPVDQVGEDIGKISQLYRVPIKDIKALGDTINWLDDNALSKGGDIIDVMKRIAGTADMAKMSFRDAAALGSTFLSLGANAEVAASASNAMIRELAVANMQSARFKEGLSMLGLDAMTVQAGMASDATNTIFMVLEKIKGLSGDKQLEAATRLFGKEFGDDAAKLASNLGEYRRQLALVNDEAARGSMDRELAARSETLNQRIENTQDAIRNLSSDLGQHLKPAMAETLETTRSVIQGIRDWAAENPKLASGIITGVKWLAILLTTLGAIAVAAGAILVPLAMLKFSMVTLGMSAGPLLATLGGFAVKAWAVINPVAKLALAFGAGYAAGTLLNKGIDALLSKILGYETTLGASIYDLQQNIRAGFSNALTWLETLPGRAVMIGSEMINGMIRGIDAKWDALKAKVSGVADGTIGWVKNRLGIRSPSRVFQEIGAFTMRGFEQGIVRNEGAPLAALDGLSRRLAGFGTAAALTMATAGFASAAPAGGNTYHITIQAAPGASMQDLADMVVQTIERHDARKAAAKRSRFSDPE